MAAPTTSTPYSTARQFIQTLPSWLSQSEAERIASYQFYEDMYWNMPNTYQLIQRGTQADPVYVPSPRVIIDTTNRFLAKEWDFVVNPKTGTPADQALLKSALSALFKRELMYAKFGTQKQFGLIRGDSVWHIVGNADKPQGSRISIYEVDPASYFPIYMDDDLDRLVGCHLVDQVEYNNTVVIRRQTYRKDLETGQITTELALFESGKWDDRDQSPYVPGTSKPGELKLIAQLVPPTPLDPRITSLPVYHVKNNRTPASPFGSSELRGLERIVAAVNQTISDEDLAIALDGIGMYVTTSSPPTDDKGNEINWILGPGRVVEIDDGSDFKRLDGVKGLPALEHARFLLENTYEAAGIPDAAVGRVDVKVAESGISLALQMQPLLAKNKDKETEMLGVHDHMLYDIVHSWFPVYEGLTIEGVEVASVVGDPMPMNKKETIDNLVSLVKEGIISAAYARVKLVELGWEIPEEMGADIVLEQQALAEARGYDAFTNRMFQEQDTTGGA